MGRTSFGDIPGNVNLIKHTFASISSDNAASTIPVFRTPYNCKIVGAHVQHSTTRASGTKTATLVLVNGSTDGSGTTALGTYYVSASGDIHNDKSNRLSTLGFQLHRRPV